MKKAADVYGRILDRVIQSETGYLYWDSIKPAVGCHRSRLGSYIGALSDSGIACLSTVFFSEVH